MSLQESQQFDENRNGQQEIKNNEIVDNLQINVDELKMDIDNDIEIQSDRDNSKQQENGISIMDDDQDEDIVEYEDSDGYYEDNKKEGQKILMNQQNPKIDNGNNRNQYNENLNEFIDFQLIKNQTACSLIQSLMGYNVDENELQKHQQCVEIIVCQFCNQSFTQCQFESHLYQEHQQFICFNCGLIDENITNQNHRLRCFQIKQLGFDDAKIQQLDSNENKYLITPKPDLD